MFFASWLIYSFDNCFSGSSNKLLYRFIRGSALTLSKESCAGLGAFGGVGFGTKSTLCISSWFASSSGPASGNSFNLDLLESVLHALKRGAHQLQELTRPSEVNNKSFGYKYDTNDPFV